MSDKETTGNLKFVISVCGGSGGGKSTLAKSLCLELGENISSRIQTDYFLKSNRFPSIEDFFKHPLEYDWNLLEDTLSQENFKFHSTPIYDFIQFQRTAMYGGKSFVLRPIVVLDSMLPYPKADFTIIIETPEEVRRARIIARDKIWTNQVISYWPLH